jgi:hypothetical protein
MPSFESSPSQIENRRDRLSGNPHNMPGVAGYPPMTNYQYWRARFEREGMDSAPGAVDPYKPGTLASNAWNDGRAYAAANREGVAA